MSAKPVNAIFALFETEDGASLALASLRNQSAAVGTVGHVAVLRADPNGKLHISEGHDMKAGKGAVIGGVTGGVIGLLGAAIAPPLAIGAVVGGLAAKLRDSGFRDENLKELGNKVQPGHSALVISVADGDTAEQLLLACGATVVRETIDGHFAETLENEVAKASVE